jgi:large subunit ribosomal protein L35
MQQKVPIKSGVWVSRFSIGKHLPPQLKGRIMPKMKTKSGAKKRFVVRAGGSIKRSSAFKRHILTKKTTKTKRQLRGTTEVHATNKASVRAMMPYA